MIATITSAGPSPTLLTWIGVPAGTTAAPPGPTGSRPGPGDRPRQDHEDLVAVEGVRIGGREAGLDAEPPGAEVGRAAARRGEAGEDEARQLEARRLLWRGWCVI